MHHILCIGACYIDTILTVPYYPAEDAKLRATSLSWRRGGNCPNTLEVLSQLVHQDVKLSLMAVLPYMGSEASRFVRDSLGPDVDCDSLGIWRDDQSEAASSYIIKSGETGSRTIVNFNGLEEMREEEFRERVDRIVGRDGDGQKWVHFEGRIPDTTLQCIQYLRTLLNSNIKISVEVEKPGREGLKELAALADVVFYSKSWAQSEGFSTAKECLEEQCKYTLPSAILCCTWGADGAVVFQKQPLKPNIWASVPAWTMDGKQVVDTIGAGDTFIAGMLYGLNCHDADWVLQRTVGFANELAGRKVVQEGFGGLGEMIVNTGEFEAV